MPVCVAYGCSNRSATKSKRQRALEESGINITLHKFPKNEERRKKWIQAICRKDWEPTKRSVICSMHFTEKDFDKTSLVVVRLREHAVPSVFEAFHDDTLHSPIEMKNSKVARNRKCYVPNCTTGYKSNKEKYSLFSVPASLDLRTAWEQNIQRTDRKLQIKDKVCEKHFRQENIIRSIEIGNTKYRYKRPRLKKDAIPIIFTKCAVNLFKSRTKKSSYNNIITDEFVEGDTIHFEMPTISGVTGSFCKKKRPNITNLIFLSITPENLEPLDWGFHFKENEDENSKSVILTKLKLSHSEPIIYKSLIIKEDLSCSMYYLKHKIHDTMISSLSHIKDIIRSMEEQNICEGVPKTSLNNPEFWNLPNAFVDQDFNCWRHKQCKIICGNQSQCDSCSSLVLKEEL